MEATVGVFGECLLQGDLWEVATVCHTVKGFGRVNKAEIDVFLELSCFFDDPADVGNLISGPLPFLNPS